MMTRWSPISANCIRHYRRMLWSTIHQGDLLAKTKPEHMHGIFEQLFTSTETVLVAVQSRRGKISVVMQSRPPEVR